MDKDIMLILFSMLKTNIVFEKAGCDWDRCINYGGVRLDRRQRKLEEPNQSIIQLNIKPRDEFGHELNQTNDN